jgi:hypothetical protein
MISRGGCFSISVVGSVPGRKQNLLRTRHFHGENIVANAFDRDSVIYKLVKSGAPA